MHYHCPRLLSALVNAAGFLTLANTSGRYHNCDWDMYCFDKLSTLYGASATRLTGVARAWYPNVFGEFDGYNDRFNTSFYKETRPDSQTIVADFNDIGDASFGAVRSYEYTAWVHTCQGGTFTFNITRADDIALAWFGDRACGDFQKDNNESSTSYQGGPGQGKSFTATIAPGEYYPVRLIYGNAGGLAILDVNITGPEGMVEEGRNDYQFFPQPCDNSNGFVPLGTEQAEGKSCVVI
ncbi:hypothetical protein EsDP_00003743 [Epichloe bromicola]|uniref:PA14 domain-containing protein n=1 Tax=Epichloe bromicola TaxID=79588 RepID=A0ABQ0CPP2_9HYPO